MKLKLFLVIAAAAALLGGCTYNCQPGYFSWAPYHCISKAPAYPVPDLSPGCAPGQLADRPGTRHYSFLGN